MKKILSLTCLALLIHFSSSAQFAEQWDKTYENSLFHDNESRSIALNNAGCIIVTGATLDTTTYSYLVHTIKYDASGNVLWQVDYSSGISSAPTDMVTDADGNIFISVDVLEGTTFKFHVVKYDCSGTLVWDAVHATTNVIVNFSSRISLDAFGNVYVGANTDCELCYLSFLGACFSEANIIKFDHNGNFITEMRTGFLPVYTSADNGGYTNLLNDMEIVGSKIYSITNLLQDSTGNTEFDDFGLSKRDTTGALEYLKRITRRAKNDFPVDLFVGPNEDIFVTGWTSDTLPNAKKSFMTVKFDSAGNVLYLKEHGDPAWSSEGSAIVVDGLGYAYVAGKTFENDTTPDIELIKYDPNGNEVWTQTYNSPFNSWDYPVNRNAYIDAQANIYICAQSKNATNFDFLVLKYDSSGSLIGEYRYNGASDKNEYPTEMLVNSAGEIFETGNAQTTNGYDFLTVKYGFQSTLTGDSLCSSVGTYQTQVDVNQFSIYPNPADQSIIINMQLTNAELKVFDLIGNEVYSSFALASTFTLQTTDWPNGVYFVQIKAGNKTETQKLIVQH